MPLQATVFWRRESFQDSCLLFSSNKRKTHSVRVGPRTARAKTMTYSEELSRIAFQIEQDAQEANLTFASKNLKESNRPPCARLENANRAVLLRRHLKLLSDPLLPRWPLCPCGGGRPPSNSTPTTSLGPEQKQNKTPPSKKGKRNPKQNFCRTASFYGSKAPRKAPSVSGAARAATSKDGGHRRGRSLRSPRAASPATTTHAEPSTPAPP